MKEGPSTLSAHGRYRIQTVAELTGVPASTLRAWEQRYGFPAPERTASAYRLYSDGDVARIARVRALCDGGMAAAEAVAAVLAEAGVVMTGVASTSVAPDAEDGATLDAQRSTLNAQRSTLNAQRSTLNAQRSPPDTLDLLELEGRLRNALLLASPKLVLAQTIAPIWQRVREGWLSGAFDRGEHRVASEILGHAARDLLRLAQPALAQGIALGGVLGDDDDLVPLLHVALALQAVGMRMISLGGRIAGGVLADAVARFDPRVIALAVIEPPGLARGRELLDDVVRAIGGRPLLLCGPGASVLAEIAARRGAFVGDDDATIAAALAASRT